jgi:hypothetical protein
MWLYEHNKLKCSKEDEEAKYKSGFNGAGHGRTDFWAIDFG